MSGRSGLPSARAVALGVCAALCLLFTALVDEPRLVKRLTRENGPVETLSALLWLGAGLASLVVSARARSMRLEWGLGGIVLVALSAREFDFQKRFFDWNLANRNNYFDASIPLDERLTVIAIGVIPLAAVVFTFLGRMARPFRDGWRRKERWTRDFPIMVAMVLVSSRLDKFHHVMPALGIASRWQYVAVMYEEAIEFSVALFVVLTLLPAWRRAVGGPPDQ